MEEEIIIQHKKSFKDKISDFFGNPRKRLIFIIVCGLILIAAVGTGLYFLTAKKANTSTSQETNTEVKKTSYETKYYSSLDGTEVADDATANKYPLGIIVENHIDARPQAGLDKASIVYEAIAEGGITRFLSIFSSHEADKVGPIRSARTYFVDWAEGYNAYLAHVGGNYDALEQIPTDKVLDLDQFKYPTPYWRDNSLKVSSEHTMFSSTIKLREQANKLGYTPTSNYRTYKFEKVKTDSDNITNSDKSDALSTVQETSATTSSEAASDINVLFSSANYNVNFVYDKDANKYKRKLSGKVQLDRESKEEIAPTNLIVMTVKRSPTKTKINEDGWNMTTIGEGEAKFFLNGTVITGKWSKKSKTDREIFYDSEGKEITFSRGQFWICVIPPDSKVTYK